ncbi:MAG TPA: PQQ-binding-like beta-propeller repeat protein [Bryobacteraceae bacterium]|jgi:alcohol dehydrogenase (cytochrome c)|nr:PQQ-binding-like beta-propeller repeat protein [Bryobacteraceae bacterium]
MRIPPAVVLPALLLVVSRVGGQQPSAGFVPVTSPMLQEPDPADWLMWRRTLNSWGYSPLQQINRANVANLRMVWSRGMGPGVQEGTPLVHNGVMYLPNPSDYIQAIDAATGDLKWEYKRQVPEDLGKFIPVPSINRNIAIFGDKIIDTSQDDFLFALDAVTGKLAWETRIVDYREAPAQETAGPLIANGKIFSTRGCEFKFSPDGCVITAHDAVTGKELWRTRTIPRPGEPGDETWGGIPDAKRRHVGAWMVPSYDAELNMLYVGTSVTSPAPKFLLAGNDKTYLYHNSTLALNADTGKIVWYYQHIVDHWDFDHPFERLLVDTAVSPDPSQVAWINPRLRPGERRKVITGIPGKTGIVYTLDRQTGEFLWARPTVTQNVVSKIDPATGAVTVNPETTFTEAGQTRFVCPTPNGGKDFQAGAYSPVTNAMYYGLQNTCMDMTAINNPNTAYSFNSRAEVTPGTNNIGTIYAISAETGKTLWKYEQRAGMMSLVATGGGLIFGGDTNGRFRAFDQDTGKVLWEVNLGSPVTGYPITFSAGGKQYVAASVGNSLVSSGLNRLAPDLHPSNASNIFVFSLP